MILSKLLMRVHLSRYNSLMIFILGVLVTLLYREILIYFGLPMSLTHISVWIMLLTVPFVHRPTVFGLLLFKGGFSIYNIVSNPYVYSVNGVVSNVVNTIATLLFAEILYRMIDGLREMNRELKKESHRARTATKAKAAFLANMSHEIRTPISGIRGLTDMLISQDECSEPFKNHLSMIKSSSDTLLHIVNNVLNFTKLEAGKELVTPVAFSVKNCVESVVNSLQTTIVDKSVTLSYEVKNSVPQLLKTDEVKMKQILFNLISNAVKFTDEGEVAVTISSDQNVLTVAVKDTGIGIPSENLDQIFTEFERVQTSYEKHREGTGLGLAITKGIIDKLGGTISVVSTLGKGSEFKTSIPFESVDENEKIPTGVSEEEKESNKGDYEILLAEDNPVNQVYMRHFLEKRGYRLTIVENGKEAVSKVKQRDYNLILMDIQMPVMSGIQATKEIRAMEKSSAKRTPILALTASVTEAEQKLFVDSGMDAVCPKPVDVAQLMSTMNSYLN